MSRPKIDRARTSIKRQPKPKLNPLAGVSKNVERRSLLTLDKIMKDLLSLSNEHKLTTAEPWQVAVTFFLLLRQSSSDLRVIKV